MTSVPDQATTPRCPSSRRGLFLLIGLGALLLLGGGLAWWESQRSICTFPIIITRGDDGRVRALYYQAADGSIGALDATTGVTRTVQPASAFLSHLLAVSPDETRLAVIETTRPITATTWYFPITTTLRLVGGGVPPQRVLLGDGLFTPNSATFLGNGLLLVTGQRAPQEPTQLYAYSVDDGSSQQITPNLRNFTVLPTLDLAIYNNVISSTDGTPGNQQLTLLDAGHAGGTRPVGEKERLIPADEPFIGGDGPLWAVPGHNTVFYTRRLAGPPVGPDSPPAARVLMGLAVRPLGTPYPVATFPADALGGGPEPSAGGDYVHWLGPRPSPLPGTPASVVFLTPAPQAVTAITWDAAGRATLATGPVPLTPVGNARWVGNSSLLVDQPGNFLGVPPQVNPSTTPGLPLLTTLQLYNPASGEHSSVDAALRTTWRGLDPRTDGELLAAVGDGLLLVGPARLAATARPNVAPNALALLWGQPVAGGWRWTALGGVPAPVGLETLAFSVYGRTPDGLALLLGLPPATPRPESGGLSPGLTLTRVPLDGSAWQPLVVLAADSLVLAVR